MTNLLTGAGGRGDSPLLDAATVVLLRDTAAGPECLMLRKTRGQAFGGLWVFPGGRIETTDGTGLDGARAAAGREVGEETGLTVEAETFVALSHWTPPMDAPKRYLTWFFVAALPDGAAEVVVDGGEIGDHVWSTPGGVLAAHIRGEVDLLPPTWVTLHRMSGHADVAAALRNAADGPVEHFTTHMARTDDGLMVAVWAPDVAYPPDPEAATLVHLDTPGHRHRLTMDPAGWRYERVGDGTAVEPEGAG